MVITADNQNLPDLFVQTQERGYTPLTEADVATLEMEDDARMRDAPRVHTTEDALNLPEAKPTQVSHSAAFH